MVYHPKIMIHSDIDICTAKVNRRVYYTFISFKFNYKLVFLHITYSLISCISVFIDVPVAESISENQKNMCLDRKDGKWEAQKPVFALGTI